MIKFFRQIRYNLMNTNQTSKYFKYAIGEILLVVIGILIALQINNWNENRKAIHKENTVVKELYDELNKNLEYTQDGIVIWNDRRVATEAMIDSIKTRGEALTPESFIDLLVGTLSYSDFVPLDSKFNRILESDQISFTQSDSLMDAMINLKSVYNTVRNYYEYNDATWLGVTQPYLNQYYSYDDLHTYIEFQKLNDTNNHLRLINDPVFLNIVYNIRGDVIPFIRNLEVCIVQIKEVMKRIETDYPSVSN